MAQGYVGPHPCSTHADAGLTGALAQAGSNGFHACVRRSGRDETADAAKSIRPNISCAGVCQELFDGSNCNPGQLARMKG
jgi:hypothetical protein